MKQIIWSVIPFVDLSPTASFQSYDHELVSSSTTSGSKAQGDDVHGKTILYFIYIV